MKKAEGFMHDINNVLTRFLGHLRIMESKHPDLKNCEHFQKVQICNRELVNLVESFQDHLHHESAMKHNAFMLKDRFENLKTAIPSIEKKFGISIELITEKCPEDVQVYSNPDLAQRVTQNCIENGVKAGADRIVMEYIAHETMVEIHIRDNGSGMDEEELKMIGFDYTTKEDDQGGLGISIVRNLVNEAGGVVEWKSIKGIGTSVIIRLKRGDV